MQWTCCSKVCCLKLIVTHGKHSSCAAQLPCHCGVAYTCLASPLGELLLFSVQYIWSDQKHRQIAACSHRPFHVAAQMLDAANVDFGDNLRDVMAKYNISSLFDGAFTKTASHLISKTPIGGKVSIVALQLEVASCATATIMLSRCYYAQQM